MSTPINQELRELRIVKEHYSNVLKKDELLKSKGIVDENVRLLSDEDIIKINSKIESIDEKIIHLLKSTKDLKL